MTGTELLAKFGLYIDDTSELSTAESLGVLNKAYYKVLNNRPWEFLKKEWSTVTTGANYLSLPTDFNYFIENGYYTDNSAGTDANSAPKYVRVGNTKYKLINWSDRKQYENAGGYAYVDIVNSKLYFTVAPTSGLTVKADYIYQPVAVTASTSPVIPERFQDVIVHYMLVDGFIIQLFPKNKSYIKENFELAESIMADLAYYNSNLINY